MYQSWCIYSYVSRRGRKDGLLLWDLRLKCRYLLLTVHLSRMSLYKFTHFLFSQAVSSPIFVRFYFFFLGVLSKALPSRFLKQNCEIYIQNIGYLSLFYWYHVTGLIHFGENVDVYLLLFSLSLLREHVQLVIFYWKQRKHLQKTSMNGLFTDA